MAHMAERLLRLLQKFLLRSPLRDVLVATPRRPRCFQSVSEDTRACAMLHPQSTRGSRLFRPQRVGRLDQSTGSSTAAGSWRVRILTVLTAQRGVKFSLAYSLCRSCYCCTRRIQAVIAIENRADTPGRVVRSSFADVYIYDGVRMSNRKAMLTTVIVPDMVM